MRISRLPASVLAIVVLSSGGVPALGCGSPRAPAPVAPAPPSAPPSAPELGRTLTGTVLQKPWSKSTESWNAGGSEYYVLDVGGATVEERSAAEGVTLLPSDQVPATALATLVGKRVEIHGEYVQAQPYVPSSNTEQYPQGGDGQPLPRGAGFRVHAVVELPPAPAP